MSQNLDQDWSMRFRNCLGNVNQQLELLMGDIDASQAKHIPKVDISRTHTTRKVPLSHTVRTAIRKKRRAWQRYMENRSEERWRQYTQQHYKTVTLVRNARQSFEGELSHEARANPKKFRRYAQSKTKTRAGIADLHTLNPDRTTKVDSTDTDKADVLGVHFSSVFTKEPAGPVQRPHSPPILFPMEISHIEADKVRGLQPSKSSGP